MISTATVTRRSGRVEAVQRPSQTPKEAQCRSPPARTRAPPCRLAPDRHLLEPCASRPSLMICERFHRPSSRKKAESAIRLWGVPSRRPSPFRYGHAFAVAIMGFVNEELRPHVRRQGISPGRTSTTSPGGSALVHGQLEARPALDTGGFRLQNPSVSMVLLAMAFGDSPRYLPSRISVTMAADASGSTWTVPAGRRCGEKRWPPIE